MKVIIDFDNTFYTTNRDVDDGMALLYLLGSPDVELVGVTSTFGNSNIDEIDRCTQNLIKDFAIEGIPYARGAARNGDYLTDASQLLVDLVNQNQGQITILAVGPLTNLQGAFLRDPDFFNKVSQIVLMGGITAPLIFAKQEMLELNFSCDPQATYTVLTEGHNVSTLTGNNCLDLILTRADYEQAFSQVDSPLMNLVKEYSDPWFTDNELEYGIQGYYNWDSLSAAYLVKPQLFVDQNQEFTVSMASLSKGSLIAEDFDPTSYVSSRPIRTINLNTPKVKSSEALRDNLFNTWLHADSLYELRKENMDV